VEIVQVAAADGAEGVKDIGFAALGQVAGRRFKRLRVI